MNSKDPTSELTGTKNNIVSIELMGRTKEVRELYKKQFLDTESRGLKIRIQRRRNYYFLTFCKRSYILNYGRKRIGM